MIFWKDELFNPWTNIECFSFNYSSSVQLGYVCWKKFLIVKKMGRRIPWIIKVLHWCSKRPYPSVVEPSTDVSPHHAGIHENDPRRCIYGSFGDPVPNTCRAQPRRATWRKTTCDNNVNLFHCDYDAQTIGPVLSETPSKPFQSIKSREGVACNAPQN